jgi:ABC-type Na+ efflux pump permease subunit
MSSNIVLDIVIATVFTVILMVALWLFMSRFADDTSDSQTNVKIALLFIGISVFSFILWYFWK